MDDSTHDFFQVHPDWNVFDIFVTQCVQYALKIDSKKDTRPMSYYVESPAGISNSFDAIAYEKCNAI